MPAGDVTPTRAMVLAAGLGLRLRPITDTLPKPLVAIAGRTMLDRALDHLSDFGIAETVVNCHYLADMVEDHLAGRNTPRIGISRESELLDTGGGVANVLDRLGDAPFFVANADIVWCDGRSPALTRLARFWRGDEMDALLLVQKVDAATGYDGKGDFRRERSGRLRRGVRPRRAAYVFTGVQMLHPRLFTGAPDGAFSLNLLYDQAENRGRLHGVVHDGEWFHVGTSEALAEAETRLGR